MRACAYVCECHSDCKGCYCRYFSSTLPSEVGLPSRARSGSMHMLGSTGLQARGNDRGAGRACRGRCSAVVFSRPLRPDLGTLCQPECMKSRKHRHVLAFIVNIRSVICMCRPFLCFNLVSQLVRECAGVCVCVYSHACCLHPWVWVCFLCMCICLLVFKCLCACVFAYVTVHV